VYSRGSDTQPAREGSESQEEEGGVEFVEIESTASPVLENNIYNIKLRVFLDKNLIYYSFMKSLTFLYKECINQAYYRASKAASRCKKNAEYISFKTSITNSLQKLC
jgi:hypothetical protein